MTNIEGMDNKKLREKDLRKNAQLNIDKFAEALVRENVISDYDAFGVLYGFFRNEQFEELSYTIDKTIKKISYENYDN